MAPTYICQEQLLKVCGHKHCKLSTGSMKCENFLINGFHLERINYKCESSVIPNLFFIRFVYREHFGSIQFRIYRNIKVAIITYVEEENRQTNTNYKRVEE